MSNLIETIEKECKEVDPQLDWFRVYYQSYVDPEMSQEEILENVRAILKEHSEE
tara:strand:- start:504 stop:665 length:162 start_codon:yes stop_codon:yes gene_type:complete